MDPAPAQRPPARRPKAKGSNAILLWLIALVVVGFGCLVVIAAVAGAADSDRVFGSGSDRVGVIQLDGPIMKTDKVIEQVRAFSERPDLQALVIRIDSPGGAVAPSQELFDALRTASKELPIVASIGSVAASGGLWVALGADEIFASAGSITGSIGVISQVPDLRGIAEWARFGMRTYKSGPVKDLGNPFRAPTALDDAVFNALINDVFDQFVDLVADRRGLEREAVLAFADGRVMSGREAHRLKLVDALGGLRAAALRALELRRERDGEGGTPEQPPSLVYPKPVHPSFFDLIAQEAGQGVRLGLKDILQAAFQDVHAREIELR